MEFVLTFTWIITLSIIAYQDFKYLKVDLVVLIFSTFIAAFIFYSNSVFERFLLNISANLIFVLTVVLILFIYSRVILKISFSKSLGVGDILFWFMLAFGFPVLTFILIFIFSIFFSYLFSFLYNKKKQKEIPLAGIQSFFLILVILINYTFQITNLYLNY